MHIIALLTLIVIIVFFTYEGFCNGLYHSSYLLINHLIGALIALTFAEHLADLIQNQIPTFQRYPGPAYLTVISVAVLFGGTRGLGSYLRQKFTAGEITSLDLLDKVGGGILGLTDGLVMSGFTLILFTLLPFLAYIPGDYGRIKTEQLPIDSGAIMLNFYKSCSEKMGGNQPFLIEEEPILQDNNRDGRPDGGPGVGFEDINENGTWDRGWMWTYRHHADFTVDDVKQAVGEENGE
ncbi:MAG: CvpA family protein [Planctomycetota bacterium]